MRRLFDPSRDTVGPFIAQANPLSSPISTMTLASVTPYLQGGKSPVGKTPCEKIPLRCIALMVIAVVLPGCGSLPSQPVAATQPAANTVSSEASQGLAPVEQEGSLEIKPPAVWMLEANPAVNTFAHLAARPAPQPARAAAVPTQNSGDRTNTAKPSENNHQAQTQAPSAPLAAAMMLPSAPATSPPTIAAPRSTIALAPPVQSPAATPVLPPPPAPQVIAPPTPAMPTLAPLPRNPRAGAYYADDGPGDIAPEQLQNVPDPHPRAEPLAASANRHYIVFGRTYKPDVERRAVRQRGIASWYGKQFHGRKTAIGETYDMYAMTAAHPTLALPSYVRVTNLATQRSVVVRVNDRGPFLNARVIDLSYAAAAKLGFVHKGSTLVDVEVILPPTQVALNP